VLGEAAGGIDQEAVAGKERIRDFLIGEGGHGAIRCWPAGRVAAGENVSGLHHAARGRIGAELIQAHLGPRMNREQLAIVYELAHDARIVLLVCHGFNPSR
jgi:hypothetical protein